MSEPTIRDFSNWASSAGIYITDPISRRHIYDFLRDYDSKKNKSERDLVLSFIHLESQGTLLLGNAIKKQLENAYIGQDAKIEVYVTLLNRNKNE